MWENGKTVKEMVKEFTIGKMDKDMKGLGKMIKEVDKENIIGKMEILMKVIG